MIKHMQNVANLSFSIGQQFGLELKDLYVLKFSGFFHDIGKFKIPKSILNKPASLTTEEFYIMKCHPIFGVEILRECGFDNTITNAILYHHERYDGKGYYNLKKENIPIFSSIIAVADAYDAMVSSRVYKKAMSPDMAIKEIRDNSGIQFHPEVVEAFVRIDINNYGAFHIMNEVIDTKESDDYKTLLLNYSSMC